MHRVSKDSRSYFKEYEMIYLRAESLEDAVFLVNEHPLFEILCGGSDAVLKIDKLDGIVDISHLVELDYIKNEGEFIEIGALSTINTILENEYLKEHLKLLVMASRSFASHQIRNIATIGGNIANASPASDIAPALLVLDAKVTLIGVDGERTLYLKDFFKGYKSLDMKNELIKSFTIPIAEGECYYKKVGARGVLNISKLTLAILKNKNGFCISV
ncbi:MAG: FAD binding domain-containing protein [Campylobacterales bacterium]|nr:FAD binding domain-containing protein [Campylobacterales bacterium]